MRDRSKLVPDAREALMAAVAFPRHAATYLPETTLLSYNVELKRRGGFVGDRASSASFYRIIEAARVQARRRGSDPFGDVAPADLRKAMLERVLRRGSSAATVIVHAAIDEFARALVGVIGTFQEKAWPRMDRVVIGGGFRHGRIGELAIARAQALLAESGSSIRLHPIRHHPDEAGIAGAIRLVPAWLLNGFDAALGVDIGGGSIRCGIVRYRGASRTRLRKVAVTESLEWEHRDDAASRTAVVDELALMIDRLAHQAKREGVALAPFVGVGCPGRIDADGRIDRGTQNLPGDWTALGFHLPTEIGRRLSAVGRERPVVLMHNDAVVQGLSEFSRMRDVKTWAVLTIGTGLGNAAFFNRPS